MEKELKINFEFPLNLTEKKEDKEKFILEGFAAANDFDLQNDIISDTALRKCINDFKKEGKVCLNHTEKEIGKLLDCHFSKGKIWVKLKITDKEIINKVKSGELNCLSIKGQIIKFEKVGLSPDLKMTLIKELHLIEVSLVPQGANPEAKAIRWYVSKAIEMAEAENNMKKKNLKEELDIEEEKDLDEEKETELGEEETEGIEKEENEFEDESEEESKEEPENDESNDKSDDKSEENKEDETELAEVDKAKWTVAYINTLPDSCFAYIEAGGKKDKEGKTEPRSLRHLPYKDASGKVDLPHLRNAIARAPHVKDKNGNKLSEAIVARIQSKLRKLLGNNTEKELSEEKVIYQVMNSGNIELEDKQDLSEFRKELLRVGSWYHGASKDGILKVTKEMLKSIVNNFKNKVLDNVFVPLGHPTVDDPSKNVGEVKDLELTKDEDKLVATIDVKEKSIAEKIRNGLIKGISASFIENYVKKDNGEHVGPTLFHAALVNEPYIKGMEGFVPLSDDYKDSLVIPILNIDVPTVLSEMEKKIKELEERIELKDKKETSEEPSKEETPEEAPKEETPDETKSSEVGKEAEEEEEGKTEESKPEEPKSEESETEEDSEEAEDDEEVELSEAENLFEKLLRAGKVTPVEKELLIPLLASNTKIELAEGKEVNLRKAMEKYLNSRSQIFSLDEFGTIESDSKKKEEEVPADVNKELEDMGFEFDEKEKKEVYEEFKGKNEKKELGESTPF